MADKENGRGIRSEDAGSASRDEGLGQQDAAAPQPPESSQHASSEEGVPGAPTTPSGAPNKDSVPQMDASAAGVHSSGGERGPFPQIDGYTIERQCNVEFLEGLEEMAKGYDCLLSMACGAGVQNLAERFADKPVFPAVNTVFIGIDRGLGWYEEKCRACGECVLGYTGGVCPVTRCAKSLFNGPCGGTQVDHCEVDKDVPCAWYDIYSRLKEQDRLENIIKIRPPMNWQNQVQRTLIQEPYKDRYYKEG